MALNNILVWIGIVIVVGIMLWLLLRKKGIIQSLFGGENAIDYIPKKEEDKNRSILIANIEKIIESSEELDKILASTNRDGRLYEKILLDKELVAQIRKAKNNEEIEKILHTWGENGGSVTVAQSASTTKTKNQKGEKKNAQTKKLRLAKKQITEHKEEKKKEEKGQIIVKTVEKEQEWTGRSKELYDEIKSLLESKNLGRLIEIIKSLTDSQIREILEHYFENFEKSQFGAILKQSQSPSDVTNLLKSETIKGLQWEYERIKNNVAVARRKGIETKNEELALLAVPQKIKMFEATFEKKDFYKVRDHLLKIERNLEEKQKEKK